MTLPLFFHSMAVPVGEEILLDPGTEKHVVQVLRMRTGDRLLLTDGQGWRGTGIIQDVGKRNCRVRIEECKQFPEPKPLLHLAIAWTKSKTRNEWMLEKITELGIHSVTPLAVSRSEKRGMPRERMEMILKSAVLQSQKFYLPKLLPVTGFEEVLKRPAHRHKLIAHCNETSSKIRLSSALAPGKDALILIGPEGDFTQEEIALAVRYGFQEVSLGSSRLRTETATVAACAFFNLING